MPIALIAHVAAGNDLNGVTTGAADMTGATLFVFGVSCYPVSGDTTLSDSQSNSPYLSAVAQQIVSFWSTKLAYFAAPTTNAAQTFAANGAVRYPSAYVAGFSGSAASPLDQTSYGSTAGATSVQPGSVTPTENDELIVTHLAPGDAASGFSIDSGFTILDSLPASVGNYQSGALAYKIQTSASAVNPTWSWSGSDAAIASIATFKSAAAGGGRIFKLAGDGGGLAGPARGLVG